MKILLIWEQVGMFFLFWWLVYLQCKTNAERKQFFTRKIPVKRSAVFILLTMITLYSCVLQDKVKSTLPTVLVYIVACPSHKMFGVSEEHVCPTLGPSWQGLLWRKQFFCVMKADQTGVCISVPLMPCFLVMKQVQVWPVNQCCQKCLLKDDIFSFCFLVFFSCMFWEGGTWIRWFLWVWNNLGYTPSPFGRHCCCSWVLELQLSGFWGALLSKEEGWVPTLFYMNWHN